MTRTAAIRTSLLSFACSAWLLAACTPARTATSDAAVSDTASPQPDAAASADAPASDEAGFALLFDGTTLAGWHLYRKPSAPVSGWSVVDGVLTRTAASGDLISDREFGDFDLRFEWKISPGGNSGVFYRAGEDEENAYWTGIEYQILDNERHPDGRNGPDRHAAAVYDMYAPEGARTVPVGDWNQGRIVAHGAHVEHWLNGVKVADYELWTPEWKTRVAQTKFKDWPRYGMLPKGHIGLQDHGDEVSYRNIRIKEL